MHPHPRSLSDELACPIDCPDAVVCGCDCAELICLEHTAEFDWCDARQCHVKPDHHMEICPDANCLGIEDWGAAI